MIVLLKDSIFEVTLLPNNFVFLGWEKNDGKFQKRLVKDFRLTEKIIQALGLEGWVVMSGDKFKGMHKILKKVGAVQFGIDGKNQHWFIKKI